GAYRIARILDGAAWDSEVHSPLRRPGIVVHQADYLLAVNGQPLNVTQDPWAAFQGLDGKTVELTLNDRPNASGARRVLVEALGGSGRRSDTWGPRACSSTAGAARGATAARTSSARPSAAR